MDTGPKLLVATALLLLGLGASWIVLPHQILPYLGVPLPDVGAGVVARLAGTAMFGLGAIAWLTRAAAPGLLRPVHQGFAAYFLSQSVVILLALMAGVFNLWGWVLLAVAIPLFAMHAGAGLGEQSRTR